MDDTSDKHTQPTRGFRPDPTEYDPAATKLGERGREMTAFLRACLCWVNHDPDAALAVLAPHWPPPRPRGAASHARHAKQS